MELEKDLQIIANDIYNLNFSNSSIMITGSTGLIGSLLVKGFLVANKEYNLNNKVFALVRNLTKAQDIFKNYLNNDNLIIVENEITNPIDLNSNIDYIFHTACVTTSSEMISHPVELIKSSVCGTLNILEFAKNHSTKSIVYLSSMEVYGVINDQDERLKENNLGFLNLTSVRSCYPESKRLNENLCKCYAEEYGINVSIARLTQTFGAGVQLSDNRIFALIAKSALNHNNIILKTTGESSHDYCYTTDAISALLVLSKKALKGETYNIANEETYCSIYQMADRVLKIFSPENKVIIENSNNTMFSQDSFIKLDTSKLRDLGWTPKINLLEMYRKLISYYEDQYKMN